MRKSVFKREKILFRRNELPENEYEKYEQGEKNRHVIHGPQHDDQLPTKSGQETHQLQYSQKSERT